MSETASPSEPPPAPLPAYLRARGEIAATFRATNGVTEAASLYETGGYRLRFPNAADGRREAVMINTGGGVAGGDHVRFAFTLEAGARVVATTAAAEKIYRAERDASEIDVTLALAEGATLDWLPQETILFDRARLSRRIGVDLAPGASLTIAEALIFGRRAMGERILAGAARDSWRVRRGGRLVFAEELSIEGDVETLLDRLAIGAGARAVATLLHVAPGAEARLEDVRSGLDGAAEAAASAWDGMLVARFAAASPEALRAAMVGALQRLGGRDLPRLWRS